MSNCGGRTVRSQSPYWRNVSPSRRKSIASKPDTRPEIVSNQIGEQLLLTLVQSLPSCVDSARARSFNPAAFRRRIRKNSRRPPEAPEMSSTKTPLRLQVGMPVRQVSGRDPASPRVAELVKRFNSISVEAFLRRRKESSIAKAKARQEEYERIPKIKRVKKGVSAMALVKAREEEYERIPMLKKRKKEGFVMAHAQDREDEYYRIPRIKGEKKSEGDPNPRSTQGASNHSLQDFPQSSPNKSQRGSQKASKHSLQDGPQGSPKRYQRNSKEASIHSLQDIPPSNQNRSHQDSKEASKHSIQDIPQNSPKRSQDREEYDRMPRIKGGKMSEDVPNPRSSQKASNHSLQDIPQDSPRRSQRNSKEASKHSLQDGPQGSLKRSQRGSKEVSNHSLQDIPQSSPRKSERNSKEASKQSLQDIPQISPKKNSPKSQRNSNLQRTSTSQNSPRAESSNQEMSNISFQDKFHERNKQDNNSPDNSQKVSTHSISQKSDNGISVHSPMATLEEPEVPPAPIKIQSPSEEQSMKTNDKIFPCFRGEYPTRHCKNAYLWFEAGVPNCGKLVTICDGEQLRPAKIVTACEVTESHYLALDDENGNDLPVSPCKKCRQVMHGYGPQQRQDWDQQQQQQEEQQEQQQQWQQQQQLQRQQMQQHQEQPQPQHMNWFGSSMRKCPCRQHQDPGRQQVSDKPQVPDRPQIPARQQQFHRTQYSPSRPAIQRSPVGQQRSSFGQQRSSFAQQRSSFGQQRSFLGQQRSSFGQQQSSFGQQQPSFGQQQPSFGQPPCPCMKRSNCRQSSPHKVCWKCQDQQQLALQNQRTLQPHPQQQQQAIQNNSYCLNEMLAEELKQQMEEAQAQIAKVQLQLKTVCRCASSNCPDCVPTPCAQYMNATAMEQDADEAFENRNLEEPTEEQQQRFNCARVDSGQLSIQFGLSPVPLSMSNQCPCCQEQAVPLRMTFSCQELPPCQQQVPPQHDIYPYQEQDSPCQQQAPPRQHQVSPYQQQDSPCQQKFPRCQPQVASFQKKYPYQRKLPPSQEESSPFQQERPLGQEELSPCQQKLPPYNRESYEPPCKQQQSPYPYQQKKIPSTSQPNMFSHAPHCCPSWYFQRYAQMRFMMPRCWPR